MSDYPLSHFLMTSTFRKMIALRVSDSPSKIKKKMSQFSEESKTMQSMQSQSKPNLEQYGYKGQLYEQQDKMNMSLDQPVDKSTMMMLASTKSSGNELLCKCHLKLV